MSQTALFLATILPATVFLGVADVLVRRILRAQRVNEQLLISFEFLGTEVILAIPLLVRGIPPILPGFWSAAITTIVLNGFAQWAWFEAFKREEASLISPLRLITPPLVILTGFLVLGEVPSFAGALGIILTVVGLFHLFYGEA